MSFTSFLSFLPITVYCERHGSLSPLAEPVNAITNLAFFISAYFIWQLLKKRGINGWKYKLLPILVLLIGVGSSAFHTFRNPYTHLMDAVPIFAFFFVYFLLFLNTIVKHTGKAILATILFAILLFTASVITSNEFLNGSIRHFVNLSVLLGMIVVAYKSCGKKANSLMHVFFVYAVAIAFRTIDNTICPLVPIGTHFTWHILNALAAYLAVKFLVKIKGK